MAKSSKTPKQKSTARNSRTTVSGPANPDTPAHGDIVAEKQDRTQSVARAFPFNPNKAAEYDPDAALAPPEGAYVKRPDPIISASTVSEVNGSEKVGSGSPNIGRNPASGPLDRVADVSLEAAPAVLYDALVLPDGASAVAALRSDGRTLEFIKDQYRHCKPILALAKGVELLRACGIDASAPENRDAGLIVSKDGAQADAFIAAIATHRHFGRETDPPRV